MGDGEARLQGVVAVQHHESYLVLDAGNLCGFQLLNLHIVGVLHNVLDGGGQTRAVGQLDNAVVLQQEQGAGFVGGVVGDCNHVAVCQIAQRGLGTRINAERLIVDGGHGHQIGALLFIEVVQIGGVLEVVGVDFAAVYNQVGLHIVFKLGDLQRPALFGKKLCGLCQNFRVGRGRSGHGDGALGLYGFCGLGTGGCAALNDQGVLVVLAVGVQQGRLVVGVEEILIAQRLDLVVQPVQQGGVALGDGGGDGVRAAQRGDAYHVTGVLNGESDDFGVVVGPGHAVAVFEGGLGFGVSVVLLQLDLGVVLFQIGFSGGAGDHDDLIVSANLVQRRDHRVLGRDNAQRHVHIRKGKVYFLRPLGGDGEVGEDDVYLAGLQILNAVGGLGGDVVDLHAKIFADAVAEVHVIALILAVLVHVAEGALVGEYANVDGAAGFDLLQRAEGALACRCVRFGRLCAAACKQGGGDGQAQENGSYFLNKVFHGKFLSF